MNSVLPFTYTLSAQGHVNDFAALGTIPPAPRLHPITPPQPSPTGGGSRLVATGTSAALIKNTGSAPAHRHYPNPPTTARITAALPPSPCVGPGGGVGDGVRPHTSLSHRQPVKPFTYTLVATLYVKRTIGCALAHHRIKNAASAINGRSLPPPQPSPGPHSKCGRILNGYPPAAGFALRGRELFRCVFRFRSLNSHNECAPAHRHYPNPPTAARIPTALPPPPWGRDGVGAASTPQSDKYKIAHHPYSSIATVLPPPSQDAPASAAGLEQLARSARKGWGGGSVLASATDAKLSSCNPPTTARIPTEQLPPPVGEGRGGVCPNTADVTKTTKTDRSFTYTLSAQVYVKHPNIGCALAQHLCLEESSITFSIVFYYDRCACPSTTESAATNPTPTLPHRGREPFRYASGFRSPNNHSARGLMRSLLNPATTTRIPAALPPPLQDAPASAAGEGVNCPGFSHRFTKPF